MAATRLVVDGSAARGQADDREAGAPTAAELAWIAAIPCALLVVAAITLVGPALGRVLFPRVSVTFWPVVQQTSAPAPERTEQARFLLALTAPLLLTGFVLLGVRRARPLRRAMVARVVWATQVVALAFVVVCYVVQYGHTFRLTAYTTSDHTVYFTIGTLVAAGAVALAIGAGIAKREVVCRFGALTAESRVRRIAGWVVAALATLVWMLPAINFENTIVYANDTIVNHLPFWLDEVFAALDGRFPLVDFAAQYGSLWTYLVAGAMALLGSSIGVFTVTMSAISAAAMLALFAAIRRVVRGSVAAVLVFLPLLATSFFMMEGPLANRYAIDNLFGTFPLRYAGPLLLAWLAARHLDGASPRRLRWLFLAAGLVVLNNVEFGIPALGATIAALLWARGRPARGGLARPALEAAIGLAGAVALVSVLTLSTAGALPRLELLLRYSRLFALGGWGLLPMTPTIGTSTIIYLTYVAAIGAATVRAVRAEPDRLMTGLLAWSGVFGLGVGSYYMGRSHPEVLTNMFPAWALCVTLLFVLAVRTVAARPSRRPTIAEAACLLGFGVLVCSLAQTPTPWSQVARLQRTGIPIYRHPLGEPFIVAHTRRGEAVAILTQLGHRIAYNHGIVDVTPYTGGRSMPTIEQFDEMLAALRAARGRKVFLSLTDERPDFPSALVQRGYALATQEKYGMAEFAMPR